MTDHFLDETPDGLAALERARRTMSQWAPTSRWRAVVSSTPQVPGLAEVMTGDPNRGVHDPVLGCLSDEMTIWYDQIRDAADAVTVQFGDWIRDHGHVLKGLGEDERRHGEWQDSTLWRFYDGSWSRRFLDASDARNTSALENWCSRGFGKSQTIWDILQARVGKTAAARAMRQDYERWRAERLQLSVDRRLAPSLTGSAATSCAPAGWP